MAESGRPMKHVFDALGLEKDPRWFLETIWDLLQFFDDVYDNDTVTNFDSALYGAFLALPTNNFYRQHQGVLAPSIHLAIEKWKLANNYEENGKADAKSYMWRACFYDILALVCILDGKAHLSQLALAMYGETFDIYMKEMELCQTQLPPPLLPSE